MTNFVKKLEDIGREEGRVFDVESAEQERKDAQKREERTRELRTHYKITRFMGYVERVADYLFGKRITR